MDVNQQLNTLLRRWNSIKLKQARYRAREQTIKNEIHEMMNAQQVNQLQGERFIATRSVRETRAVRKFAVPPEIWEEYSSVSEYPALTIRRHA